MILEFMKYFNFFLGIELIVDVSFWCWIRCSFYLSSSGWRKKCCGVCNLVVFLLIVKVVILKGVGKKSFCCGMIFLDVIFNKFISKVIVRFERLQVGLQFYKCRVFYKLGVNNLVDYMSCYFDFKQFLSFYYILRVNVFVNVVGIYVVFFVVSF